MQLQYFAFLKMISKVDSTTCLCCLLVLLFVCFNKKWGVLY